MTEKASFRFDFQTAKTISDAQISDTPISDTSPRSRGAMRPSCAGTIRPGKQRAWGMPGARRTRSLACSVKNTRVSHHGRTGTPGIPARNGFNGLFRALPGDRACLSPSLADKASLRPVGPTCLRKLDAGVEASGPHDFAVRSNISRQHAARSLTGP